MTLRSAMVVIGLAAAVALAKEERTQEQQPKLNDAQIATLALTAHELDLERGKLAKKHARNKMVKQFAQQMIDDHGAGKKEVLDLAEKLGVKPQESDQSRELKQQAARTNDDLKKRRRDDFDRAYIDAEVKFHEAVIDMVENVLIPNAKNREVRTALENTVPTLQGHLKHAKDIQGQLGQGVGGAGD